MQHTHRFGRQSITHDHAEIGPHGYYGHPEDPVPEIVRILRVTLTAARIPAQVSYGYEGGGIRMDMDTEAADRLCGALIGRSEI